MGSDATARHVRLRQPCKSIEDIPEPLRGQLTAMPVRMPRRGWGSRLHCNGTRSFLQSHQQSMAALSVDKVVAASSRQQQQSSENAPLFRLRMEPVAAAAVSSSSSVSSRRICIRSWPPRQAGRRAQTPPLLNLLPLWHACLTWFPAWLGTSREPLRQLQQQQQQSVWGCENLPPPPHTYGGSRYLVA